MLNGPPPPKKYGFYGRLSSSFPSQVIVDVTEICNLACIHCPHPDFKRSEHYEGRHLDVELNRKLVDEVREHGAGSTQYIRYTSMGEPLIHPHIYDMLDYAVQHSGVFVTLTTNGTILNEPRIEKLLASGLNLVDISIDAYSEKTYSKIRVNGQLQITRNNVLKLIEMRKRAGAPTRIAVSFVEQAENKDEAAEFEAFWKEHGADSVVIRRLHSAAGSVSKIATALRTEEPRRPCLYPWERIMLNPLGQLGFCPEDWVHGSAVADYRRTTIREVWTGEIYRKLRQAHMDNSFASHPFCGQCPDWKQTRWPGQGRSYADLVQDFKAAP